MKIAVPTGKWVRRTDERPDVNVPVLAYGLGERVLVVWSDGSHTTEPAEWTVPASNWEVWEEVG